MMKRLLFIFALVFYFSELFSQQAFSEMNANNIACSVTATGDLFNNFGVESVSGFEVPAGSGLRTMYAANLWVGGLSPDQQLKLAAETYEADGHDWFPGPLTIDGNASTTEATMDAYNQVWVANSADVETHIAYFDALEIGQSAVDELFPNGYTIPNWFFTWPAHGDVKSGFAFNLAPFMDQNNNGIYDPENGDYPSFCGDECLYYIFNDKGNVHTESQGQPIGLEVHGMLYAFHSEADDMLANTVFLKYKIINRGTQTLTNTYMGIWSDFDIGNATDDYVATNVQRSALLAYNGDDIDENGYEENPPMQAIAFLGGPFLDADELDNPLPDEEFSAETNSYGYAAVGFEDGLQDNERFGLLHSAYYNIGSNPINGDMTTAVHYYNYMRGIWKNGSNMLYGGDAVSGPGVENYSANYMFPGTSDPLYMGTEGLESPLWMEDIAGNPPGDRRMIGSSGPFTLMPDAIHHLDLAFVFNQTDSDIDLFSLTDQRLKEAKLYWNEYLQHCEYEQISLGQAELNSYLISVYPNPMSDLLSISVPPSWNKVGFEIFDIAGNLVKSMNISGGLQQINIEDLSAGTYALKVQYGDQLLTQKIIVQ